MRSIGPTSAGRAVAQLVDDLSNWYVRRSRRRFWDGDPAAFATLRDCLLGASKLLAPLTPFVTDEIYDNLDGGGGIDIVYTLTSKDIQLDDNTAVAGAMTFGSYAEAASRLADITREELKHNRPLAPGSGDDAFVAANRDRWLNG